MSGAHEWLAAALAAFMALGCGDDKATRNAAPTSVHEDAAPATRSDPEHETLVITGVAVKVIDPETPREIYPRLLAKRAGQVLTASPAIIGEQDPVPPGEHGRRATVELVIRYGTSSPGEDPAIAAAVAAEVIWERGDDLAAAADILAERPIDPDERKNLDGIVADHVERTVIQAAKVVAYKESVRTATEAEILAAMKDADPELAAWALTVAGDRELSSAVDPAIALLSSERRMVVDAAIGALANLGARRAVPALTALSNPEDTTRTRTLIEALAVIGGDDAVVFLEYVATGHPKPEIRDHAKDALARARATTSAD